MRELWTIDPATYARHSLHRADRAWPESNCYVDLWIELLHASALEPLAALPCVFTVDLEGDQWTFFKFPLADLYTLYGADVFELNVWRSLVPHLEEQLAQGRPCIVEVDAFHLPDTGGTCYRTEHVKTSIAVQMLDANARRLGYFHNAGYYELEGPDFAGVFRLEGHLANPELLPPYVEVVKLAERAPHRGHALAGASLELLRAHLGKRPSGNPFRRYARRFPADLEWLGGQPFGQFHGYAFGTFRQCGAAFELGGAYLRWLETQGEYGLERIAVGCDLVATTARTLELRTARRVKAGRRFDPAPMLETMAAAWDETMMGLTERYGVVGCQG
jgi:hypothetical protein